MPVIIIVNYVIINQAGTVIQLFVQLTVIRETNI